jgi:hypothetical protein
MRKRIRIARPAPGQPEYLAIGATDSPAPATSAVRDLLDSEAVTTGAGIALIYHGYRRTGSVLWALIYGIAGKKVPELAVPIAAAQGFGQKKGCP